MNGYIIQPLPRFHPLPRLIRWIKWIVPTPLKFELDVTWCSIHFEISIPYLVWFRFYRLQVGPECTYHLRLFDSIKPIFNFGKAGR